MNATEAAMRHAERMRCRNAVMAIALMAAVAIALVMVRGLALATGPSLLAAAAAGVGLYLLLGALVCSAVPVTTAATSAVRSDPTAGSLTARPVGAQRVVEAPVPAPRTPEPVREAAEEPTLPDPSPMMAGPGTIGAKPVAPEAVAPEAVAPDAVAPEPVAPDAVAPAEIAVTPADALTPIVKPAVPRQIDRALMMALASTRATPADRRTLPTDTRRVRVPKPAVEPASDAAAKITKAAKATKPTKPPSPLAGLAMAPAAPVRAVRPRVARSDASLPPIADGAAPVVAGGIDAAIERSRHATKVTTGDVVRLARPRGGVADDLKLIRGVGPKLEALLNAAGIWHFDQIATWKARDIAEIDAALKGFHGRITRDGWVKQARTFVAMGTAGRTTARTARRTQRNKADS